MPQSTYVWRDLLNLALGNRDNHGRNTAILKDTDHTMRLAPLFDVGPTFLDARAITRVLRWDGESPGTQNWAVILDRLDLRAQEAGVAIYAQQVALNEESFIPRGRAQRDEKLASSPSRLRHDPEG